MKLSPRTFNKKLSEQHGRCFYCGNLLAASPIEIDHILPFSASRNGQVTNLCLSCKECNRLKGDKTLDEFKAKISISAPSKLIRGLFYYEFINLYPRG